jgi:hypothetical protein
MVLALLQAAIVPPEAPNPAAAPPFVEHAMADAGVVYTVEAFPADKLSEIQDLLDAAAARHCGTRSIVPGDQSYDQSTDSSGLPAFLITHLRMTYRCA